MLLVYIVEKEKEAPVDKVEVIWAALAEEAKTKAHAMHKQVVWWAQKGGPQEDVLYYFIRQMIEDGLISFYEINSA